MDREDNDVDFDDAYRDACRDLFQCTEHFNDKAKIRAHHFPYTLIRSRLCGVNIGKQHAYKAAQIMQEVDLGIKVSQKRLEYLRDRYDHYVAHLLNLSEREVEVKQRLTENVVSVTFEREPEESQKESKNLLLAGLGIEMPETKSRDSFQEGSWLRYGPQKLLAWFNYGNLLVWVGVKNVYLPEGLRILNLSIYEKTELRYKIGFLEDEQYTETVQTSYRIELSRRLSTLGAENKSTILCEFFQSSHSDAELGFHLVGFFRTLHLLKKITQYAGKLVAVLAPSLPADCVSPADYSAYSSRYENLRKLGQSLGITLGVPFVALHIMPSPFENDSRVWSLPHFNEKPIFVNNKATAEYFSRFRHELFRIGDRLGKVSKLYQEILHEEPTVWYSTDLGTDNLPSEDPDHK
jgi:hypothetical protein